LSFPTEAQTKKLEKVNIEKRKSRDFFISLLYVEREPSTAQFCEPSFILKKERTLQ